MKSTIKLLFLVSLISFPASAQEKPASPTSAEGEQRLVQRIKEEVIKELKAGFLREQIELGIQDHLKKQQQAQVAAGAEKMRLANQRASKIRRVNPGRDHIYGDPNAVISLIEYSDFECPFCKRFHSTPKGIVDSYKGRVNWVYRHLPLSMHNPGAQKQAEASECAAELGGNGAFWRYIDAIYSRTTSGGRGFAITALTPLATEIGLSSEAFAQCMASGRATARVREDMVDATQIGVLGTPSIFLLNNKTGEVRIQTRNQAPPINADIEGMLQ